MCQPLQTTDVTFVTMKSITGTVSSSGSLNDSGNLIVVKVCNTSEEIKKEAADREARILKNLNCQYVNKYVDYYDDPEVNKAYLVLEYAGSKSLCQFVEESKLNVLLDEDH